MNVGRSTRFYPRKYVFRPDEMSGNQTYVDATYDLNERILKVDPGTASVLMESIRYRIRELQAKIATARMKGPMGKAEAETCAQQAVRLQTIVDAYEEAQGHHYGAALPTYDGP